jgi:hypothetical protein
VELHSVDQCNSLGMVEITWGQEFLETSENLEKL